MTNIPIMPGPDPASTEPPEDLRDLVLSLYNDFDKISSKVDTFKSDVDTLRTDFESRERRIDAQFQDLRGAFHDLRGASKADSDAIRNDIRASKADSDSIRCDIRDLRDLFKSSSPKSHSVPANTTGQSRVSIP